MLVVDLVVLHYFTQIHLAALSQNGFIVGGFEMKPVVGILTCGFEEKRQFITDNYVKAIRLSGGTPLLIPALPPDYDI